MYILYVLGGTDIGNQADEAFQRWRSRRRRQIQSRVDAAEAAAAADAGEAEANDAPKRSWVAGRMAGLGQAALRQLKVFICIHTCKGTYTCTCIYI